MDTNFADFPNQLDVIKKLILSPITKSVLFWERRTAFGKKHQPRVIVRTNPSPNSNRNSIRADGKRSGPRSTNNCSGGAAGDTDDAPLKNVLRQHKKLARQIPILLQYASIDKPLPENPSITARHASIVRRFAIRPLSSIESRYCRQSNPAEKNVAQLTVTAEPSSGTSGGTLKRRTPAVRRRGLMI